MTHRFAPLLLLLAGAALAQPPLTSAPATQPGAGPIKPATVQVSLQTSEGPILLELEKERAPVTAANFLHYVDTHRLDGTSFYRAVKVQPGFGLVQGGVRDGAKLFPPIAHEPTTRTGLSHVSGTISMARAAPGSAAADFFIVVGDQPTMDANPALPGDNLGFAAFGHVVQGMEVVTRIMEAPTSPTEGPAAMKGQMLVAPIRILSATRVR